MKTLNYVKVLLLSVLTFGITSCGDEYYTDDYLKNSDEKLCRVEWVDTYITEDDELCTHTLYFELDGSGRDVRRYQFREGSGWTTHYTEIREPFTWKWVDKKTMEALYMDYMKEGRKLFENVWVREHYLSGRLEGYHVTFKGPGMP